MPSEENIYIQTRVYIAKQKSMLDILMYYLYEKFYLQLQKMYTTTAKLVIFYVVYLYQLA